MPFSIVNVPLLLIAGLPFLLHSTLPSPLNVKLPLTPTTTGVFSFSLITALFISRVSFLSTLIISPAPRPPVILTVPPLGTAAIASLAVSYFTPSTDMDVSSAIESP